MIHFALMLEQLGFSTMEIDVILAVRKTCGRLESLIVTENLYSLR